MTLAQVVDIVGLALATGLPALFVWRWRIVGVAAGAVTFWAILAAIGPILSKLDPRREGALLDAMSFNFGWLVGVVYSLCLLAISAVIRRLLRDSTPVRAVPGESS